MENVPFAGTWRGREGVRAFLRKLTESQEVVEFRPEQFISSRFAPAIEANHAVVLEERRMNSTPPR